MGTTPLVLLIVGGAILFAAGIVFFVLALIRLIHRVSGLGRLLPVFASPPVEASQYRRQSVKVGSTIYKRCADVSLLPEGLQLSVRSWFLGNPSVCVPWGQVTEIGEGRLHWRQAVRLSIGRPEMVTILLPGEMLGPVRDRMRSLAGQVPSAPPTRPVG